MADKKCLDGTGLRTVADWIISKLSGKSDTSHKHTKSDITDFPTALKNPSTLTVQFNGTTQAAYDGSAAKTVNITPSGIGAAASGHTHNYAGASTAGGSATSAVKLDTSAGSATNPVYFSGGKPVKCSYSLQKSVPADAVFTDTNTWRGIQNNLTSDSTTDSLAAAQGKALKALVDGKAASSHTHTKSQITDLSTYAPIYNGNILNISEMGTYSCHPDDCTNLPSEITSWCYITMYQFRDTGYKRFMCIALNSIYTGAKLGAIWLASETYKDSNGNLIWSKTGVDVVIGTSSGTVAYKSGYTKAVVEFWKTTVGSASRTVYDAALITGLSSSMTASTPSAISSGQDFAFAVGNNASGGIIISGNFSKYKITYFN